eukprot:3772442-Rhodomonas_salina.1
MSLLDHTLSHYWHHALAQYCTADLSTAACPILLLQSLSAAPCALSHSWHHKERRRSTIAYHAMSAYATSVPDTA